MRLRELLEGNFFKDTDFVKHEDDGQRVIDYDLAEDIAHYMDHDDHCYRRYTYPALAKFLDMKEGKGHPKPAIFKEAVKDAYKVYVRKFPIRELPDELDEDTVKQVCELLYDEHDQHHAEGKYKD
jgi:hypothetical protein